MHAPRMSKPRAVPRLPHRRLSLALEYRLLRAERGGDNDNGNSSMQVILLEGHLHSSHCVEQTSPPLTPPITA